MSEPTIEYWDIEEPVGSLTHKSPDEAIEMILDSLAGFPIPRTLVIFGWARKDLTMDCAKESVDYAIGILWESLDGVYSHDDSGDTAPSAAGKAAIELASWTLAKAIHDHYPTNVYHTVQSTKMAVDCEAWIRMRAPGRMEECTWRGFEGDTDDARAD